MSKSRKIDSVTTSKGNVFTAWQDSSGRVSYRKNGQFVSKTAAVAAASSKGAHSRDLEIVRRVDLDKPAHTFRDMTYKDSRGRWRAGEDARAYMPWLREGQLISKAEQKELRNIRFRERNFYAFQHAKANEGRSKSEIKDRYIQFLDALDLLDYEDALAEYWDDSYSQGVYAGA